VNHSVRRFVRPVLMRDPIVWLEQHPDQQWLCPPPDGGSTTTKPPAG
jgi:hypothetical protein